MKKYSFLFLVILLAPALAEVSECTNNASCPSGVALRNLTIVTGFFGATVSSCNSDADCADTSWLKCFKDWDGTGPDGNNAGWCNSTAITSCYNNGTAYVNTYNFCTATTKYRTCSSGAWGAETTCSGNQTCTSGTASPCGTSSSTSSSSSSSSITTNATPTPSARASISVTSAIKDFDLVQNESAVKSLTAKNDGNITLKDVRITVPLPGIGSGINEPRYTITGTFATLSAGSNATFIFNFSAPENATVKSYTVTTEVTSSDAKTSVTFVLRILPSNATVQATILPLYDILKAQLEALEKNVSALEQKGINTTVMKRLLEDIKGKLNQTAGSIEKKDYFAASQLLDSAKALISDLQSYIAQAKVPGLDFVLIAIIIIIIVGVAAFLYMMWPTKEGFAIKKGWKPEKEESVIDRIAAKIKRKKDTYAG